MATIAVRWLAGRVMRGRRVGDSVSVSLVSEVDVLEFTAQLLSLIDTTRYTATYKLASLIAIMDLVAEHIGVDADAPTEISGLEVGRRVVSMYWPQSRPFATGSVGLGTLVQSSSNDIPAKLATWRRDHDIGEGASVDEARAVDPVQWDRLYSQLAATVIRMPLTKLQRFGDGRRAVEDRFLFDFSWNDQVSDGAVLRDGFDDRLCFKPGVGGLLVRLGPLLRPLLETRWVELVAARNTDLVDSFQLHEFLFGASRISLERVRGPLVDMQHGRCFYCGGPVGRSAAIDHFLPWSRHPDNMLDNLVATDQQCNGSKSASLAGVEHLRRWVERFDSGSLADQGLRHIVALTGWPRRSERTLPSARASYLWMPATARLWVSRSELEVVDTATVRKILMDAGVGLVAGDTI